MADERIVINELSLSRTSEVLDGAWFQRSVRDHVNGTATVFNITGPHQLEAEIHYIQLENNERWVMLGERYSGPKWIWKQTKERLKMTITEKDGVPMFDLPLPSPGKRDKDIFTMSLAPYEDLESILPNFENVLKTVGVTAVGQRSDLFGDTSSRKRYIGAMIENTDCLAPIIGFCISRLLPLIQTYEKLFASGEIQEEFTHMLGDAKLQLGEEKVDELTETIAKGESAYVEFKPAIWYNHDRALHEPNYNVKKEEKVSDNIIRTIVGFLNAEGGTLFIGVSDDGNAYGLEPDLNLTRRKDLDGLENELNQLIIHSIPKEIAAIKVKISFPTFQDKIIAKLVMTKSNKAVFMKDSRHLDRFYVRIGNATNSLSVESAMNYISEHDWS